MNEGNVLSLFNAPSREDALSAISRTILRIKADRGVTYAQLGIVLECSADTLENAVNERSLMSADTMLRLQFHFPEESQFIAALRGGSVPASRTVEDRLAAIENHIDAIKRETAS